MPMFTLAGIVLFRSMVYVLGQKKEMGVTVIKVLGTKQNLASIK